MAYWHPEMTADLRDLWEVQGASAAVCARRLNAKYGTDFTRNSIVGKVFRMGLAERFTKVRDRKERKVNTDGIKPAISSHWNKHPGQRRPVEKKDTRPIRETFIVPLHERKQLEHLEHTDCRYPYGDELPYGFCGRKTVPGASYCHAHFELCCTSARVARETETSDPKILDNSTPADGRVKENA